MLVQNIHNIIIDNLFIFIFFVSVITSVYIQDNLEFGRNS
jgi:hypothetical protein